MKIIGLITEYNPFHNGHLYHLRRSKEITGADYCIALMSGSFVQRGEPAVFDKYARTAMALQAGVDLVLELPVSFSTASAMEFASFGVSLFTALGSVHSICFGSECGQIEPLENTARLLAQEPPEFKELLLSGLKRGMTYPEARSQALGLLLPSFESEIGADLLLSPNNLLGVEYIKAGILQQSPISFVTFRREGSSYHEEELPKVSSEGCDSRFPSASAIRLALAAADQTAPLQSLIPPASLEALRGEVPVFADDFSSLLNYRLLNGQWEDIADLSPELEARLRKNILPPVSFTERIQALKSRQLTYTRVSRALLHLALDIRKTPQNTWKQEGYAPYARILGFRKESAPLLKQLKKTSSIPLVTKVADARKTLSPSALSMLEQEIRAAHLYQMVKQEQNGQVTCFKNEYRQGVVIL